MALDATVGGSDANSLLDLARAEMLVLDGRVHTATWDAQSSADKRAALVEGSRRLVAAFQWFGSRVSDAQALPWPRYGVQIDGVLLSSATIPKAIEEAVITIAFHILENAPGEAGALQAAGLESIKVDVIALTASNTDPSEELLPDGLGGFLRDFGRLEGGNGGSAYQVKLRRG